MRSMSLLIGLLAAAGASAGQFNDKLSVGDAAPAWKNLPGIDGKKHSLADLKDSKAVVVVFTCNSCPTAIDYEDRIIAFAKEHCAEGSGIALVAINVNTIDADKPEKMKERAKEKGFNFPYLYDETQAIAKAFGARTTPEFFVLDAERKVAYMGALDDKNDPKQAKVNHLAAGLAAAMAGKKADEGETLARGCAIRFARPRRTDD